MIEIIYNVLKVKKITLTIERLSSCTLMLCLRRWSCGGKGMPPTRRAVLMLGRPTTSSFACLSIWMASSLVGVRMRAAGLPTPSAGLWGGRGYIYRVNG